jgi:hypothetical protein
MEPLLKETDNQALQAIEDALDAVLTAIHKHDAERPKGGPLKAYTWAEIADRGLVDSDVEELSEDPVGAALRQAVWRLGKKLYAVLGETRAMSGVLERVASRDPANYGKRVSIMDNRWEGIGKGNDVWLP